jgi:hypothetical protein
MTGYIDILTVISLMAIDLLMISLMAIDLLKIAELIREVKGL